jgi:hypothetical protein
MSLINNALSEIGDQIIFQLQVPIVGLDSIVSWTDDTIGETLTRYFRKQFRYSVDGGLNWSELLDLTDEILATIDVNPIWDILFEYTYTRIGTDTTGVLIFNNVQIFGTYVNQPPGDIFVNSVFATFFTNVNEGELQLWSMNVLDKVYRPGIVSKSLIRNLYDNMNPEDRDYIDFWRSITTYFSLFVGYSRKFEKFQTVKLLLVKYLEARDIHVCQDMSLVDLNYVLRNYYDEMRHRGTYMISKKKGSYINVTTFSKPVHGEILRLICYNQLIDEFLFCVQEFGTSGWVIDEYSPLWQGVSHQYQLNKMYEIGDDVIDLTKYPLINPSYCSIGTDGSKQVLVINNVPDLEKAGIGDILDEDKRIIVDSSLDYELSFMIRSDDFLNAKFSVRVHGFDSLGLSAPLYEVVTGSFTPWNDAILFCQFPTTPTYFRVRVNLYGSNTVITADPAMTLPNIGQLTNLQFDPDVIKIVPEIVLDNDLGGVSSSIFLWGIKLTPLVTPYNTSFVDIDHIIQIWSKNNEPKYTSQQINEIIKYKLIPLGATLINNEL